MKTGIEKKEPDLNESLKVIMRRFKDTLIRDHVPKTDWEIILVDWMAKVRVFYEETASFNGYTFEFQTTSGHPLENFTKRFHPIRGATFGMALRKAKEQCLSEGFLPLLMIAAKTEETIKSILGDRPKLLFKNIDTINLDPKIGWEAVLLEGIAKVRVYYDEEKYHGHAFEFQTISGHPLNCTMADYFINWPNGVSFGTTIDVVNGLYKTRRDFLPQLRVAAEAVEFSIKPSLYLLVLQHKSADKDSEMGPKKYFSHFTNFPFGHPNHKYGPMATWLSEEEKSKAKKMSEDEAKELAKKWPQGEMGFHFTFEKVVG